MKRWTAWKLLPPKKPGAKPGKFPRSLTNDDQTWRTFGEALAECGARGGVGFMMLGCSTLVGIDLDRCLDPATGAQSELARALLGAVPDTYAEITPSGTGFRIFALVPQDTKIPEFTSSKGVECYVGRSPRFLTVTGNVLPGREGKLAVLTPAALQLLRPFATSETTAEIEIKLPVPTFERLAGEGDWQGLINNPRLPYNKLKKEWREFLGLGDLPGGRSERAFAIACALLEARYPAEQVFAILVSAPGSWEAALDKRDQDPTRARALIWADIGRAQKVLRAERKEEADRADEWSALGLRTVFKDKRVCVERSQMNLARVLTEHATWQARVALDITTGLVLLDSTPLDDYRLFDLMEKVNAFCVWEPGSLRQWWVDAIRAVATKNPVNPRAAELRALRWDGVPRLDTWFVEHVAEDDDSLNRAIGRKWPLSCVARWLDPGSQVDTVLVLQGEEGARKNTFFRVFAGAADRVIPINGFERDDKFTIANAWLAEMPEAHLFRKADRNRLKSFVTDPIDNYRPPYAAMPVAVKRAFVIVSSANPGPLFNNDQDGLRRFWPVQVKERIDYEWVQENRDQLLAEAVVAYDMRDMTGETWWFDKSPKELKERVEASVEATVIDEALVDLVHKQRGKGGMSLTEIVIEVGAKLGYRPTDRSIVALLDKYGIRQRRVATHRFWLHPSWARPGKSGEADVIPLHGEQTSAPAECDEVLS